jgi:hypothetical protein
MPHPAPDRYIATTPMMRPKRSDNLEIDKSLHSDATNAAQLAVPGDSRRDGCEQKRRDDHADKAQKEVAKKAGLYGNTRSVEAQFNAAKHGQKRPREQRRTKRGRDGKERESGDAK